MSEAVNAGLPIKERIWVAYQEARTKHYFEPDVTAYLDQIFELERGQTLKFQRMIEDPTGCQPAEVDGYRKSMPLLLEKMERFFTEFRDCSGPTAVDKARFAMAPPQPIPPSSQQLFEGRMTSLQRSGVVFELHGAALMVRPMQKLAELNEDRSWLVKHKEQIIALLMRDKDAWLVE